MSLHTSVNSFSDMLKGTQLRVPVKGTQSLSHLGRNCGLKLCWGTVGGLSW